MTAKIFIFVLHVKAHVHPSGFARLSLCFGMVHLLNAVFRLAVISQVTIFNYRKFPQCIQGDNGPLRPVALSYLLASSIFFFFFFGGGGVVRFAMQPIT